MMGNSMVEMGSFAVHNKGRDQHGDDGGIQANAQVPVIMKIEQMASAKITNIKLTAEPSELDLERW